MDRRSDSVAAFIACSIEQGGHSVERIAGDAGLASAEQLTAILDGREVLAVRHASRLATALGADPLRLTMLCLQESEPDLWPAIEPLLDLSLTEDERRLVDNMRRWVGVPFLSCLDDTSLQHLNAMLHSLRVQHAQAPSIQ